MYRVRAELDGRRAKDLETTDRDRALEDFARLSRQIQRGEAVGFVSLTECGHILHHAQSEGYVRKGGYPTERRGMAALTALMEASRAA